MPRITRIVRPIRAARLIVLCAICASCRATTISGGEPRAVSSQVATSTLARRALDASLTLTAMPAAGQARSFQFVAEIAGGADNNPDLYCVATTWAFGDGPGVTVSPSCVPWSADVRIRRHFENTHNYEQPGAYTATFAYGTLTARADVEVK